MIYATDAGVFLVRKHFWLLIIVNRNFFYHGQITEVD